MRKLPPNSGPPSDRAPSAAGSEALCFPPREWIAPEGVVEISNPDQAAALLRTPEIRGTLWPALTWEGWLAAPQLYAAHLQNDECGVEIVGRSKFRDGPGVLTWNIAAAIQATGFAAVHPGLARAIYRDLRELVHPFFSLDPRRAYHSVLEWNPHRAIPTNFGAPNLAITLFGRGDLIYTGSAPTPQQPMLDESAWYSVPTGTVLFDKGDLIRSCPVADKENPRLVFRVEMLD